MARRSSAHPDLVAIPQLAHETLYVGVDVGKFRHVAGFLSRTLLARHQRFEGCPTLTFEQSREGFRALVDRIRELVPIEQATILLEYTGHYHKNLEQYLLELDMTVYRIHVQERPKGMMKTDKRDALGLANRLYSQLELGAKARRQNAVGSTDRATDPSCRTTARLHATSLRTGTPADPIEKQIDRHLRRDLSRVDPNFSRSQSRSGPGFSRKVPDTP